jgi:DNA polymerase (family 10)
MLEMIEAAQRHHYEYLAITDHSQRVTVAKGLDEFQLQEQWSNINKIQGSFPDIRILKGVELDILEDGALDMPKETLKEADWVIAAIHYGLKQSPQVITKRLIKAIQSGLVHAIAHPTGRLIGKRPAYDFEWTEVCKAAVDYGCALEINGQPSRLDLNEQALSRAMNYPVHFVVSSDAHSMNELNFMKFAVYQARRGGLAAPNILNTRDLRLLKSKATTS